jgi:hypothetical protein
VVCVTGTKLDPALNRLLDELADDLLNLSDSELLAELVADGLDENAEAAAARDAIAGGIARAGQQRLAAARAAVSRDRKSRVVRPPLRPDVRDAVLAGFANDNPKLKSRLTMAARNGEGITEKEMDAILDDLRELGVIDDEGNPA